MQFANILYFDSFYRDIAFQLNKTKENGRNKFLYSYLGYPLKYTVEPGALEDFDETCIPYLNTNLKKRIGKLYLGIKKLIDLKLFGELNEYF